MARSTSLTKTTRRSWGRDLHAQWRSVGGTGPWTQEPHPFVHRATDSVTYGPNWENWRLRLALKYNVTTYLTGVRHSSKASELFMQVLGKKGVWDGFGRTAVGYSPLLTFPGDPGVAIDSNAERMAASRFLGSYLKATRTWHGGATIAEFSEAVRFLASPVRSLYRHTFEFIGRVGRLRKVFKRDPVKYGKLLGSLWLTWAFGLSPLVADVNSAHAAVQKLATDLGSVDMLRIVGNGEHSYAAVTTGIGVPYTSYCVQDRTESFTGQVRYLGMVACKPPGVSAIAENFGVGFSDIIPSVWEGIPWSWLVDYFVNMQEMLDSLKLATADFRWVNRTIRNSRTNFLSDVRLNISPMDAYYMSGSAGGGQGWCKRTAVLRTTATVPYPSWTFRIPGMPSQFANVSALFLAIQRSKPPR